MISLTKNNDDVFLNNFSILVITTNIISKYTVLTITTNMSKD
jgi:hypothetical protein